MQSNLQLTSVASFGLGSLAAWALPLGRFLPVFLALIGITVLLGIANAVDAKEQKPLPPGLQVLSFLALSTTRPNSVIQPSAVFAWFLRSAAGALGMGATIVWLAQHV